MRKDQNRPESHLTWAGDSTASLVTSNVFLLSVLLSIDPDIIRHH